MTKSENKWSYEITAQHTSNSGSELYILILNSITVN